MFRFATRSNPQPAWVQLLLNPLNDPELGCVTTTPSPPRITPPPTGTSETFTNAPAGGPEVVGVGEGCGVGVGELDVAVASPVGELPPGLGPVEPLLAPLPDVPTELPLVAEAPAPVAPLLVDVVAESPGFALALADGDPPDVGEVGDVGVSDPLDSPTPGEPEGVSGPDADNPPPESEPPHAASNGTAQAAQRRARRVARV